MIEIAFDKNKDNLFLNKPYPIFKMPENTTDNLQQLRQTAQKLLTEMAGQKAVIINDLDSRCRNLFAVALFIEAYHDSRGIECVVFKVQDTMAATEEYKPYLALTISLKYIFRLAEECPRTIYKEISELGYLGLDIKEDYTANILHLRLNGSRPVIKISTADKNQALIAAGILKAAALARRGISLSVDMQITNENTALTPEKIIPNIINTFLEEI